MKKVFMTVLAIVMLTLTSICYAYGGYPDYWNEDKAVLCDGHMGTGWYVYSESIHLDYSNEYNKVISFKLVTVPDIDKGCKTSAGSRTYIINFDERLMKMTLQSPMGNWESMYLDPNAPDSQTRPFMAAGEVVYYLVTSNKFYGDRAFEDTFYDRLRNYRNY